MSDRSDIDDDEVSLVDEEDDEDGDDVSSSTDDEDYDDEEEDDRSLLDENLFNIKRTLNEDQIVQKLRRLRDENVFGEIRFYVDEITWTERIRQEMIWTFEYYTNLGRQWQQAFFINLGSETSVHAHLVIRSPFTTQLFRKFKFESHLLFPSQPMAIEVATSIAFILRNGGHLESVIILGFEIGLDAMSVLSESLVTHDGKSHTQNLELFCVRFSNDGESPEGRSVVQCLADGLARNRTLTSFSFDRCEVIDSFTAMIVRSLTGHPSLRKLYLQELQFGEETTNAICRHLLAFPTCILSDLVLSRFAWERRATTGFDFARFLDQLPVTISLQSLELSHFGQDIDHVSANFLLERLWWKLPSLKRLRLQGNTIRDLVGLVSNLTTTPHRTCLRVLDLEKNSFDFGGQPTSDENSTLAILQLLEVFPELGYLGYCVEDQFLASVTLRLDLNRFSGMLLRGAEVPLSVWAVVLAKVNSKRSYPYSIDRQREINVIYQILHGPLIEELGNQQ